MSNSAGIGFVSGLQLQDYMYMFSQMLLNVGPLFLPAKLYLFCVVICFFLFDCYAKARDKDMEAQGGNRAFVCGCQ